MICGICNANTSPVVNLLQCIQVSLFGRCLVELSAGFLAIITLLFHTFCQCLHPKKFHGCTHTFKWDIYLAAFQTALLPMMIAHQFHSMLYKFCS
jgi:hypothetical protein